MLLLIVGLVLFLGIHSIQIVAPLWRESRIAAMGKAAWMGTYAVVSLASFLMILWGYSAAKEVAQTLYQPFATLYVPTLVLMAVAMILLTVYLMAMVGFASGHIKQRTRHPFLLAIILWSGVHLWMNGDTASVLLFGSFLVWAVLDLHSAMRRPKGEMLNPVLRNDIIAVVVGVALAGIFSARLHLWLIGVAPII